jgi:hypothetical protein
MKVAIGHSERVQSVVFARCLDMKQVVRDISYLLMCNAQFYFSAIALTALPLVGHLSCQREVTKRIVDFLMYNL